MKARNFFAGFFLFVFLLAAARNVAAQAQQVRLTEDQQTALIVQSAKKIKELNDKLAAGVQLTPADQRAISDLSRRLASLEASATSATGSGDLEMMLKRLESLEHLTRPAGKLVYSDGKTIKGLRDADTEHRKGIEGLRKHTQDLQMGQQTIIAAQILVGKGIKNPTDLQYAEVLAEAKKIGDIANPLDRTKALFKALSPASDADVQQARAEASKAVQIANDAKAKAESADTKASQAKADALMASRDALDAKAQAKAAGDAADQSKADAAMATKIANDAKAVADGAKNTAEEVAQNVQNLQGEIDDTQKLSEATARTVVKVVKEDSDVLCDYFYNLSEAGISFSAIGLTLADVQKRGLFGKEPDTVQEFTKFLTGKFKDRGLSPEDAARKAESLTAGMAVK